MNLFLVAATVIGAFILGYRFYGRILARAMDLKENETTPAQKYNDGNDFVPTRPSILIGQHFAAIAAVGPIVGPIIAGMAYGWLPGLIWITLGAIFVGGAHDFAALVASVRHNARSVAEMMKQYVNPRAYYLFLLFIWLSLIYVIVVFADLTAAAFVQPPYGPGVATSSLIYLLLAVGVGTLLYRTKFPLWLATTLFLPLLGLIIWGGQYFPISFGALGFLSDRQVWHLAILGYCFIASIIPMWLLLQPRGYLGAVFLFGTFAAGLIGMLFGGFTVQFPAFQDPLKFIGLPTATAVPIFPLMFITIACGACSGFHGVVSSGTSSKQLHRETDAPAVGYGGMLLEGVVALIAMATVMMLVAGDPTLKLAPDEIYARGIAKFMMIIGIPFAFAVTFGKLAFTTFIYDTLDVATRLGRYILQELTGLQGKTGAYVATFATVAFPALLLMWEVRGAEGQIIPLWKAFWPLFGSSNQLLAALSLLGITVWLRRSGKNPWLTGLPAAFMTVITVWSLILITMPWWGDVLRGQILMDPIGITGTILLVAALSILWEGVHSLIAHP